MFLSIWTVSSCHGAWLTQQRTVGKGFDEVTAGAETETVHLVCQKLLRVWFDAVIQLLPCPFQKKQRQKRRP